MAFDVNSLGGKLIDNQELKKLIEQGGGGGDSGFTVTFTVNTILDDAQYGSNYEATCDKTANEIMSAISSGEKINLKITSLDYDETMKTSHYITLSTYAYSQDGEYGITTLMDYNKSVGFYYADGAIQCSVSQYAEVPIGYIVSMPSGTAIDNYGDVFTGARANIKFADNRQITFQIEGNFYRPLSCSYNYSQQKATIAFVKDDAIKKYTLDDSGNFAEVV